MPKVTLEDVAEAAGVSTATVDRVINRRGGVRAEKEEHVVRVARSLGLDRQLSHVPSRLKRIAILIQPPSNPFHAVLRDGFRLSLETFAALGLQLQIRHIDPNRPERTAGDILRAGTTCDGLILCAPNSPAIGDALRKVTGLVPVVTVATDIAACGRLAYIGPDDEKAGRVAGDLMGIFLRPRGGEILMVAGRMDFEGHQARARGFADILERHHPGCRLSAVVETGETPGQARDRVHQALKRNPAIRGIYNVSVGSVGMVASLQSLGRSDDVVFITHELTPNRRRLLQERKLHAVIDQKPMTEARLALETVARALGRLDGTPGSIPTEIQIFMPENC
jgi:LacI family transcriptional regulator